MRRWGPSDIYTKTAPAALRIFAAFCETTFATLLVTNGSIPARAARLYYPQEQTSSGCADQLSPPPIPDVWQRRLSSKDAVSLHPQ